MTSSELEQIDWAGPRYQRFAAATEVPLLILAVAFVPVLVIPEVTHVSVQEKVGLDVVDWSIWAAFALEFTVRLFLSHRRIHMLRHNWLDLLIIALPMLRPLRLVRSARALRLLRLSRLGTLLGASTERTKRSLHARSVTYVLVVSVGLTIICSVLMLDVERHAPHANIRTYGDALWWSVTTISTVGYGDRYPTTAAGRVIALMLILAGVSLFGVVTAAVAAWFVRRVEQEDADNGVHLAARLDRLEVQLARVENLLIAAQQPGTSIQPGPSIDLRPRSGDGVLTEPPPSRVEGSA